ncbi:RidA family protein [Solimonas soli]|uniref:RidA family protein n=1 Tax=Solimonas soli TaxID=413479 RepID=UPI0004B9ADF6|nr:RidA family protein [Solimonas soli]
MIKRVLSLGLPSAALGAALLFASAAQAADKAVVIYNPKKAPIASAVEVPAGKTLVFLSGKLSQVVVDPKAPKESPASLGDTETQTYGALKVIEEDLKSMGLGMKDVVKMTVFLAGDPAKEGKLDFGGMMKSYTKFFGTPEQPNVPARSTVQVAALAGPQYLVEVEVMAVRP